MTYPGNFLRLVASGTLYGGIETFSFSMSIVPDFPGGEIDQSPDAVPAGIVSAFSDWFASPYISNAARLTVLKLNEIGPDGRYVSTGNTVLHDYGPTGPAGTGTVKIAPQIALAVTLRTARSRGRAHAGRFYVPVPAMTLGEDGRVPDGQVVNFLTTTVTLLNEINEALPGFRIGVASDIGTGEFEEVTGVTIGRTLDTIRSRRTSIPEGYPSPVALAP